MRIRKIALGILLILTALMVIDIRWSLTSSHKFGIQGPMMKFEYTYEDGVLGMPNSTQESNMSFTTDNISEFFVSNSHGRINIQGADTNEVSITAKITVYASTQEEADAYLQDINLEISQENERAELVMIKQQDLPKSGKMTVNYDITVPHALFVNVQSNNGNLSINDLIGPVQLTAAYAIVAANNIAGHIEGSFNFSTIRMEEIKASLDLESNYSTLELDLVDTAEGYDFDVEVAFGNFSNNFQLQHETEDNLLKAQGQTGNGERPVRINARLGNVEITK